MYQKSNHQKHMPAKQNLTLRTATIRDLEVLAYWDQQQHVIDSDPDDDWDWAYELTRFPDWREQLIAVVDDRPIGCLQIIDPAREETHYWGEVSENLRAIDIWIGMKDDLGKGYGAQMMTQAIERCFAAPEVDAILIDPLTSNTDAIRFYEKLGFRFLKNQTFGQSGCSVYQLSRDDWDKTVG